MHAAELSFEFRSPEAAALVADAIKIEIDDFDADRATTTMERVDDRLQLDIEAEDLVALRAGLNTWQTLLEVAERAAEAGQIEQELG